MKKFVRKSEHDYRQFLRIREGEEMHGTAASGKRELGVFILSPYCEVESGEKKEANANGLYLAGGEGSRRPSFEGSRRKRVQNLQDLMQQPAGYKELGVKGQRGGQHTKYILDNRGQELGLRKRRPSITIGLLGD